MKKHRLVLLMTIVFFLTASALFASAYAFRAQRLTMDSMIRSYVMDLLESASNHVLYNTSNTTEKGYGENMIHFRMLSATMPLQNADAGGIVVLTKDREILACTSGCDNLVDLWRDGLILGEPTEVTDKAGRSYYVVVREVKDSTYVLAAVSKTHLLAPVASLLRFWIMTTVLASAAVLAGMLLLWKYLIVPLRGIVEKIKDMNWGKDSIELPYPKMLFEVEALSDAILQLSETAIAKEEMKARYVGDLVQVQEEAKKQLARELHDGPLQAVVASVKRIQLAQRKPIHLEMAERTTQIAATELRNYCDELSPSWVKLGLASAMQENVDRLAEIYGVDFDLDMDETLDDLSEDHVLALVRILQEATSNSVRHGNASSIQVELKKEGEQIFFSIHDDGRGFQASAESDYEHLRTMGHRGLANMNERVRLLGGKMEIQAQSGQGCRIKIVFIHKSN